MTRERVSRIIGLIGKKADVVVQVEDARTQHRVKYASAHDIRRGLAQRLINAGVSAETLKSAYATQGLRHHGKALSCCAFRTKCRSGNHCPITSCHRKQQICGGISGGSKVFARIKRRGAGTVVVPGDFLDPGSRQAIGVALHRMEKFALHTRRRSRMEVPAKPRRSGPRTFQSGPGTPLCDCSFDRLTRRHQSINVTCGMPQKIHRGVGIDRPFVSGEHGHQPESPHSGVVLVAPE
jgi:hypothetical protein